MNALFAFNPPNKSERPYSISEINTGISRIIESGNTLVWVEGELSNYKKATSGHCYLRLKDEESQVPAVIWKQSAYKLEFVPQDGMQVIAIASIRVYEKGGYYQLDIHKMQPAGVGALYASFMALKARLEKEGLFDLDRKKPLPKTVKTLGVITSKRGAALFDIVKVVRSRSPRTHIIVIDIPVQGDAAPSRIVQALKEMNRFAKVDCIVLGRGGGSIEDLWAFNDEAVARAIVASRIPVISAVGHEIDFTIADFAADVRAATPSAAAEIAVPDDRENTRYFVALSQRLYSVFNRVYADAQMSFDNVITRNSWQKPWFLLRDSMQKIRDIKQRKNRAVQQHFKTARTHFEEMAARLHSVSPLGVFARGYSVVSDKNGGTVKNASQLSCNDPITIYFEKGKASAVITEIDEIWNLQKKY